MESKSGNRPVISPKTKIGELLEAWPQLEDVLIEMSPVFEKLRNPILRRTVARVATIQQISVVGGIPVENIINRLREETGQMAETNNEGIISDSLGEQPSWFDEEKIKISYDATSVINAGESPMTEVLAKANKLNSGEILELQSPFIPAPVLDILQSKNFKTWSVQKGNIFFNYIFKT